MSRYNWIKEIKVLIWDLDGTLYHEIPELKKTILQNTVKVVAKTKRIPFPEAEKLFLKNYKRFKSNTKTLFHLGVDKDYVISGDWYNQAQLKFIKKDPLLANVFKKLQNLRHIIHTNSERKIALRKLKILGLDLNFFEKIFTSSDMLGKAKPDLAAFKLVLQFTKLKPNQHLFLGDSVGKEVMPAKKLGMRTCLVWGKSDLADISLKKVYDIVNLF